MASSNVQIDRDGMTELLKDQDVASHLEQLGERVKAAMDSTAPVESGALARSHSVEVDQHADRTVVHIGSDLDYAAHIAASTGYMARALDAAKGA